MRGFALIVALAACSSSDDVELAPDAPPVDAMVDASTGIELIIEMRIDDGLEATLDGTTLPVESTITRTLANLSELESVAFELVVRRGDDSGPVIIRSSCASDARPCWPEHGDLLRETLNVGLRWSDQFDVPTTSSSGHCFFRDGTDLGWIAD